MYGWQEAEKLRAPDTRGVFLGGGEGGCSMWEDSSRTSEGGQLMLEFGIGFFFLLGRVGRGIMYIRTA